MLRDLLGNRATDELLLQLEPLVDQCQRLGWKELRPWSEFFGTFKPPQMNVRHLEQRVTTNFLHYRSNYLTLLGGILALRILFNPTILFVLATVTIIFVYVIYIHQRPFIVGDYSFEGKKKLYLCLGVSSFLMLITGTFLKLLWTLFYTIILCGAHMVFRPRSVSSKANRMYEEMKMNGYNLDSFMGTLVNTQDIYSTSNKSYDNYDSSYSSKSDGTYDPESFEAKTSTFEYKSENLQHRRGTGSSKYND